MADSKEYDDYWWKAVQLFTGYEAPARHTLFDQIVGNAGIKQMKVEINKQGSVKTIDADDLNWMVENAGWDIQNTDFVIPFYTNGDSGVRYYKARFTLLGAKIADGKPVGGEVVGGEGKSKYGKELSGGHFKPSDNGTVWNTFDLTSYSYGTGKALKALLEDPNGTLGFSWGGKPPIPLNKGVRLDSFDMAADAFDRVAKFFWDSNATMTEWQNKMGQDENEAWKGQAAGVFWDLIHELGRRYGHYADDMEPVGGMSKQGKALRQAGQDLRTQAEAIYNKWDFWNMAMGNPLRWLVDLLSEIASETWNRNLTQINADYTYTYSGGAGRWLYSPTGAFTQHAWDSGNANRAQRTYGDMKDLSTWKNVGDQAIADWEASVKTHLIDPAEQAMKELATAWGTSHFDLGSIRTKGDKGVEEQYNEEKAYKEKRDAEAKAEKDKKEAEDKYDKDKKDAEAKAERDKKEAEDKYDKDKKDAEEKAAQQKAEQEKKEKAAEEKADQKEKEAERKQAEQEAKQEQIRQDQEAKQEQKEKEAEQKQAEQEAKQEQIRQDQEAKQEQQQKQAEQKQAEQQAKQDEAQRQAQALQVQQVSQQKAEQEKRDKEQAKKQAEQEAKQEQIRQEQEQKQAEQEKKQEEKEKEAEQKQAEQEAKQEQVRQEQEQKQEEKEKEAEQKQAEQEAKQEQVRQEQEQKQEQKEKEAEQKQAQAQAEQEQVRQEQEQKQEQKEKEAEQKQAEAQQKQEKLQEEQQKRQEDLQQQQQQKQEEFQKQQLKLNGSLNNGDLGQLNNGDLSQLSPDISGPVNGDDSLTNPDGSQSHLDSQGRLVTDFPDGSKSEIDPNSQTATITRPDGSHFSGPLNAGDSLTNPDGSTTHLDPQGQVVTEYPDGSTSRVDPDTGATSITSPDGTTTTGYLNDPDYALPDYQNSGPGSGSHSGALNPPSYDYGDPSYEEELYDDKPYQEPSLGGTGQSAGGSPGAGGGTPLNSGPMPPGVSGMNGMGGTGGMPMGGMPMGGMGGMGGGKGGEGGPSERVRNVIDSGDVVSNRRGAPAPRGGGTYEDRQAVSTSGGNPFLPGMGGGAGGPGQTETESSDREREVWEPEEDDVWGTDEGGSPAVIGR
ncbi:AAWKG family protein [Streptomyces sp. NPDC001700]